MAGTYDVMVDIETTGISPDHAGVIQIAAVKFNLKERTIKTDSMFNHCLHLLPGRYWEEGTRSWWTSKNADVLESILSRREEPTAVLNYFHDWFVADNDCAEPLRLWCKPLSFDAPILASHLKQIGLETPWHYRYGMDVNSFLRGLGKDPNGELYFSEMDGPAHDAIYDCIGQIKNLFAAMEHYNEA